MQVSPALRRLFINLLQSLDVFGGHFFSLSTQSVSALYWAEVNSQGVLLSANKTDSDLPRVPCVYTESLMRWDAKLFSEKSVECHKSLFSLKSYNYTACHGKK